MIIAELGQAHEGSLGIAHSYIDALAKTGVDAIKFQTHIAEAESSLAEPFRVKFSYEDDTRFEYWRRMEFTEEQWVGLKKHCDDLNVEFVSSPFSNAAVDLLEKLNVKRYKIGSGEVNNLLMLEKIAQTGKPILISSGMSSFTELDKTLEFFNDKDNEISIFQCTTSYPCPAGDWGLNIIPQLKERYQLPVGFSDHSGDIFACLAATAMGAELLEFHAVFDKRMFGPDATSSLTIDQVARLVDGVKQIRKEQQVYQNYKEDNSRFNELKGIFEKTLSLNKDLSKGHTITFDDLEAKKPAKMGIPAGEFSNVIGKKLSIDKNKWDFLSESDLEN